MVRQEARRRVWSRTVMMVAIASGIALTSGCGSGGGGGSSDGLLCQQCGQSDGPCRQLVTVTGSDAQALCSSGQTSCEVQLACFRKLGSAQRRCFPADARFEQFECDGARANRNTATPIPSTTPTPSGSVTPTATGPTPTGATPTSTASPGVTATFGPTPEPTPSGCGNGVLDDDEECDNNIIDNTSCFEDVCTCEDFCDDAGGTLSCNADCTVNFTKCTAGGCSF
jgi:hypothetical protein